MSTSRTRLVTGGLAGTLALVASGGCLAKTVVVRATDVIYAVDKFAPLGGGTVPKAVIAIPPGVTCGEVRKVTGSLQCLPEGGCITLNGHRNLNDADGFFAQVTSSSNQGYGSISGISAPGAGYLVGVFTPPDGPNGKAPPPLHYLRSSTHFTYAAPLLDQVFFIGDGRTGHSSGAPQHFAVPKGAGFVTFGISDACGFKGAPGCYFDNAGTYTVVVDMVRGGCVPPPAP